MLMVGGMAVDLMRHERMRTELQQTLDRSVLAAAGLTQTLDAEAVVTDSFAKAGLADYLKDVKVETGLNFRKVSALAIAETRPFFMDMMGIDELPAAAASSAEQQINNVEIVLVLDVSGSMTESAGTKTKIVRLKEAASKFIDDVLDVDGGNRVSVSIVPYNAQVNLGIDLRKKYNYTYEHGMTDVECLELPSSVFSTMDMSRTVPLPMFSYADTSNGTTNGSGTGNNAYVAINSTSSATNSFQFCNRTSPSLRNIVRLPSSNATNLKAQINGLVAAGNTSITLGMRWGLALIDPGARPMFSEFATDGKIDTAYSVRPFEYDDEDAMKVIVLMTDGIHVSHNQVKPAFKTGLSPIYYDAGSQKYSIRFTSGRPAIALANEYWVPHLVPTNATSLATGWQATAFGGGAAVQQTWQQVWDKLRVSYVAWQLYGRALGTDGATRVSKYNTQMGLFQEQWASTTTMDSRLTASCNLARAHKSATLAQPKVIVFTIAFQAPLGAQTLLKNCATSTGHYFDAQGTGINDAFDLIANQINYLRLTQ
jgi:hypothetical protein